MGQDLIFSRQQFFYEEKYRMIILTAQDYIEKLKLTLHPEGGFYSVVYKSQDQVKPLHPRYFEEARSAGTSIYYLLEKNDFSAWHKVRSDELWHYYDGGSVINIYVIARDGSLKMYKLGNPAIDSEAMFQVVVEAECWFCAEVKNKNSFALVGCTVSPGFEFEDFELANRQKLLARYPEYKEIIMQFTRE